MDKIDKKIKSLIQQDEVISPKAEEIFNNFFSEKNIEKNTNNKHNMVYKIRKIIAIITCVAGLLGGANVYASSNGYGNVFFLIKYLVTGEKTEITNKNELLSDRDITISYKPISLTENLEMQIRNLQIKDNKAKLIMVVNESKENDVSPLKYKVYNESNKLICEQDSSNNNKSLGEYQEELLLNDFKNEEQKLAK